MDVERGASLKSLNTLALEASAAVLATVADDRELLAALQLADAEGLPALALGAGSNIVLAGDVAAVLIRQSSRGVEVLADNGASVDLRVVAGENWHAFVSWALEQNYFGLENLALIPGTVGAAPIQNIGAYGIELGQFVRAVHGVSVADARPVTLSAQECRFGYRDSVFKQELRDRIIITSVDFRLAKTPSPRIEYPSLAAVLDKSEAEITPRMVFDAVVAIRRARLPDPLRIPNAGSFFKNPVVGHARAAYLRTRFPGLPAFPQADGRVKLAAAWMIEHCGWKGREQSGVAVHDAHALVLVNCGADSGSALMELAADIQRDVQQEFGYLLEIEPRVLGATVD